MLDKNTGLRITWIIIAISQLVLGVAFLFFPTFMYGLMGIAVPTVGVNYILGMLSARLLTYGAIMMVIRKEIPRHRLWLDGMMVIQAIDLLAGVYHVFIGAAPLAAAAFPMINAAVFLAALTVFRPAKM